MYLLWTRLTYILFIRNEMTILGHQELGTRERNILCLLLFSMKSIAEQRSDMTCVVLHLFYPEWGCSGSLCVLGPPWLEWPTWS